MLVSLVVILLINVLIPTSEASQLSTAQKQKQQLQNQIAQNRIRMSGQKQVARAGKNRLEHIHALITNLIDEIDSNTNKTQRILSKVRVLNVEMNKNQTELNKNEATVENLLKADYEYGRISYLSILFHATSFSDLLSRIYFISIVTQNENKLLVQTMSLQKVLHDQQDIQKQNYEQLFQNGRQLYSLKQQKLKEETQASYALTMTTHGIDALTQQQQSLAKNLNMTEREIQQLEAEAKQQEDILASHSGSSTVVVPALRYQDIPRTKLYEFVNSNGSAFSLTDIETICDVAKSYDVNPALLLAITGQELDFVQNGTLNETEKLENPFDVFGSWALYHTTLMQSAAYAAEIIQVKLSVSPPAGENAIIWINDPNNHAGLGVYATDPNLAYGVGTFFNEIEAYVSSLA